MAQRSARHDEPGIAELGSGLWELVLGYLKQETLAPVKALGRYVVFGAAGSMLAAVGLVLLVLAGLRAMQEDTGTTFAGAHSWMPYAVCAVATLAVMGFAALRIVRPRPADPGGAGPSGGVPR